MLNILTLPVGQLKTNCYIVHDTSSSECIVIDPGDEADFIIQKVKDYELAPTWLIATHTHFDHIQAVLELKWAFNTPFYIHPADQSLLGHYRRSAMYFTKFDPGPPPIPDAFLKHQDVIGQNCFEFSIIHTPGHTPGSISLYSKKEGVVFTGDTIFADGGVGRTDHSYSNPLALANSIKKILDLPSKTIILPGHGQASTVLKERQEHIT